MTSRQFPPPPPASVVAHHRRQSHQLLLVAAVAFPSVIFLLLVFLLLYFSYFSHCRSSTRPVDSPLPSRFRRFSYQELHAATSGFAVSRSLGRGATAAVFLGILPDGKSVAVKRLDLHPASPKLSGGDREFLNELQLLSNLRQSAFVVSLLGFCLEGNHHRLMVYEYMSNGSLQELLFGPLRPPIDWSRRFQIILDIAKALTFLHLSDPPIIHGDIKPSNVLLGQDFQVKISDFGLSRLKTEVAASPAAELFSQELSSGSPQVDITLPICPSFSSFCSSSSSSCLNHEKNVRPKGKESAVSPCYEELGCVENNNLFHRSSPLNDGRDSGWKKDDRSELSSRDYVMEWIGSQVFSEKNPDLDEVQKSSLEFRNLGFEAGSLDETHISDSGLGSNGCNERERKIREWWKEEYFEEISKKGKGDNGLKCFRTSNNCNKDTSSSSSYNGYKNHIGDGELNANVSFTDGWKKNKKKRKKKSRPATNEMSSGDLFSKELSSTRSMRGTVCYIAPERSGCGDLTEKADIYNFGVLILVIISGRRPLHVLESPLKLDTANLISWCRKLAQTGNVLDIVDENLKESYNKDQVSFCINLALLCLQRIPDLRPDSWDIVKLLEGEKETSSIPI
ncbi:putative receptor-like protein kinase At1g80870 [Dendrobium catenatum]|uniref:Receptor-like protein kinase n=1 Tax=Dendrobium catenatum TaxID=906689 RepID=A0A2I0VIN3_9ASPA|nr:putative receptor-like protein kinase At1g80870 [Dendrobium catenatum]PKU63276.1 Putative receptor-like protein kinase [Dendrobium catenatum]